MTILFHVLLNLNCNKYKSLSLVECMANLIYVKFRLEARVSYTEHTFRYS